MSRLYSDEEHEKLVEQTRAELAARPKPHKTDGPCDCDSPIHTEPGRSMNTHLCLKCGAQWTDNDPGAATAAAWDIVYRGGLSG